MSIVNDPFLLLAVFGGLLSCFFAANNLALHQFSTLKLEELLRDRDQLLRLDRLGSHREELMLLTAIARAVCNLIVLFGSIVFFERIYPAEGSWIPVLYAFSLAALIILVFGVAIPFSWARWSSELLLARSLPLLVVVSKLCKPATFVLGLLDPFMRRLLGVAEDADDDYTPLEREILDVVTEGEKTGLVDEAQREMIEALIEFPSITVGEIMTPRTDVKGVEVHADLETVKKIIADAGHSRFPVYETDLDHIVGILYAKDMLPYVGIDLAESFHLADNLRQALLVPESKTVRDLLREFQTEKVHLAIVLDEYGGTAGLVSIEDILEEIVGEIHDEYEPEDVEEPRMDQINSRTLEVDARVYIDDLNDEIEADLPEDEDYDTVGGFVFSQLGHIPSEGESFEFENVRFTVIEAEKTKVRKVRVESLKQEATPTTEVTEK